MHLGPVRILTIRKLPFGGRVSRRIDIRCIQSLALISYLSLLAIGCAGTSLNTNIANDPNIKNLKVYNGISVGKWKDTKIHVAEGDTLILTPLYPKGFIYSVQGKIGEGGENFDALDIDIGDIYKVKFAGTLHIGVYKKSKAIATGVFIFKNDNLDNMLADLGYIQTNNKASKVINLTLGILFKKKGDSLVLQNRNAEALRSLDRAIHYFEYADKRLYSATIYRLHKMKANLHKLNGNFEKFNESISHALDSLMKASQYYTMLHKPKYSFLKNLTQEERFLLLTRTTFFSKTSIPYDSRHGHSFAHLSYAYASLAEYYTQMGNLGLSLQYCEKAIQEAELDGNRNLIAMAYHSLGMRHARLGFFNLAENACLTALNYCSARAEWTRWGIDLILAVSQYEMNKLDSAERVLKEMEAALPRGAHLRPLYVSYALSMVYIKRKEYDKAIPRLKRLYVSYKNISGPSELSSPTIFVRVGLNLCQCYIGLGDSYRASEFLNKIEADIDSLANPIRLKLEAMIIKSRVMEEFGKDSVVPLMEAIEALEKIRPTAASNTDYEYWERMLTVYDTTVESIYQRGDFVKALEVAEKARSRRFLDYLGNKRLGAKGAVGYALTQQANANLESLSMLEDDLVQAATQSGIKLRNVYQKDTRYSKRLENYRKTLSEAGGIDMQFALTYNITPVTPKEIQKKLPDDLTIIEYYLSDNALYTWVIDHKNIHAMKRDVSRAKIRDLIMAFRNSISVNAVQRGIRVTKGLEKDFSEEGQELYKLLFSPIEEYIKTTKISIVPYGILNYLPFQALYDGKQYLIEKNAISYIPSLSILEFLKRSESKDSFKIIAFGNPNLNDEKLDLPSAEKEVEMIKTIFPSATILKRGKATEATAKKVAKQYDIIHFASHGEYFPEAPLASCIRLSPGEGEDGRLEASEVFDMDINADLVVTSACQTAIGQISKGDEIVGLTRGFIYAGANSVFGSLWSISDKATAVLMNEFYSNIKQFGRAEALRQAQLKMIQSREYSKPFYWAAFNITGGF